MIAKDFQTGVSTSILTVSPNLFSTLKPEGCFYFPLLRLRVNSLARPAGLHPLATPPSPGSDFLLQLCEPSFNPPTYPALSITKILSVQNALHPPGLPGASSPVTSSGWPWSTPRLGRLPCHLLPRSCAPSPSKLSLPLWAGHLPCPLGHFFHEGTHRLGVAQYWDPRACPGLGGR